MKILAVNGSPRGNSSNSWQLANAFICGIEAAIPDAEVYRMDVNKMNVRPCLGCFACWGKTPGKCCIDDDARLFLEKRLWADITVWSFPLYYYTVPGALKTLIDRQLPMVKPFLVERTDGFGSGAHPSRYDMSKKKNVVISTCGFWTAEGNYDGVHSLFSHMCGIINYETIFCGEGELFRVPQLKELTGAYLDAVTVAGTEYTGGEISAETRARLSQPILPRHIFEEMANSSWTAQ